MNRYWDLSEKERSELTTDQVEATITVELMEKGVVKVESPVLRDIPPLELSKRTVFAVENGAARYGREDTGFVFNTIEDAQKFIASNHMKNEYDYDIGSQYHYAHPMANMSIKTIELCDEQAVLSLKPKLSKREEDRKANEAAKEAYSKAVKVQQEAGAGVWEDYYKCGTKSRANQKVIDVFKEYTATCNGDEMLARKFLAKAFTVSQISEAFEWFGLTDPNHVAQEMPAEEATA